MLKPVAVAKVSATQLLALRLLQRSSQVFLVPCWGSGSPINSDPAPTLSFSNFRKLKRVITGRLVFYFKILSEFVVPRFIDLHSPYI